MTGRLSVSLPDNHDALSLLTSNAELRILALLSLVYFIWTHSTLATPAPYTLQLNKDSPASSTATLNRPGSPRNFEGKDARKASTPLSTVDKSDFGYIWMSVPKNYRSVKIIGSAR
jgi:hypothetical protein